MTTPAAKVSRRSYSRGLAHGADTAEGVKVTAGAFAPPGARKAPAPAAPATTPAPRRTARQLAGGLAHIVDTAGGVKLLRTSRVSATAGLAAPQAALALPAPSEDRFSIVDGVDGSFVVTDGTDRCVCSSRELAKRVLASLEAAS